MTTRSSTRGSALLMVFWAVVMMSICVLGLVGYLYSDLDETTALEKDASALQLAESGVAIGMHPLVARDDPALRQTVAPGEEFEVRLSSEGGRLNINTVLQNKEWDVLLALFQEWGLPESDASPVVDSIKNWSSTNEAAAGAGTMTAAAPPTTTGTSGAEPQFLRVFQSVDEMLTVPGMELVAQAKPDWRDYFTIWSDGTLDMNDAPADLIVAVCGVGSEQAQQLVNTRLGPDGVPHTSDDMVFTSLDQVRSLLGMSQDRFAGIQGLLSIKDSATRIESTGALGPYRRKITAVVRKNDSPPVIFLWQEL